LDLTHVTSFFSTHASFLTNQTRSKYGPTLQVSYVVLPIITSRPLRLPYAPNTHLAGFIRLDRCLPRAEPHGDAGISGPTSVIFHRMPMAIPRVPCRCSCPLLPCRLRPSPRFDRIGVYPRLAGFIPHPDSPSNSRPGFFHEAAPFALCYGLRLWLAPLTGYDPHPRRAFSGPCRGKFSPCVTT
jgi:hypothetical protein